MNNYQHKTVTVPSKLSVIMHIATRHTIAVLSSYLRIMNIVDFRFVQQRQVSKRLATADRRIGTTCESESVFSKLQLTSIRSTMTEDRLEALPLLQVQCHREHCPTKDDVLSA